MKAYVLYIIDCVIVGIYALSILSACLLTPKQPSLATAFFNQQNQQSLATATVVEEVEVELGSEQDNKA